MIAKERNRLFSENYRATFADLRDLKLVKSQLESLKIDFEAETLCFAECVLNYIDPTVRLFKLILTLRMPLI